LSRKWKRSSFDSVALNIRTGTLTRPKEIVPVQRERAMTSWYPLRGTAKTPACFEFRSPRYYKSQLGVVFLKKLLHLTGG
jgi:hypothetical protein